MPDALMRTAMLALEMYDPALAGHSRRRGALAVALAERANAATTGPYLDWRCSPPELDAIRCAGLLADVGYIGVRRALLERASPLTAEERRQIEAHASHSYELLRTVPWEGTHAGVPEIVRAHHERMDGSGYPRGLRGSDVPVESRMIAIADAFDALTAVDRPWKKAVPVEMALDILAEEARLGKLDRDLLTLFVDAAVWRG
jgi:HD-GYP domain-containing protein (c-di-GMP phosphodiesterase class II)